MKTLLFACINIFLFIATSCNQVDTKHSETSAQLKEKELIAREKDLAQKEKEFLAIQHQELQAKTEIKKYKFNADDIYGIWNIKMKCLESDCQGISNKGDIKTETWSINLVNGKIIAKVTNGENKINQYLGFLEGDLLVLQAEVKQQTLFDTKISKAKIAVKLDNPDRFSGEREVLNPQPCRIVYQIIGTK